MNTIKTKRGLTVSWAEKLRQMSVGSVLECTTEEKDLLAPTAVYLKMKEGKAYTFKKDRSTKKHRITRLK